MGKEPRTGEEGCPDHPACPGLWVGPGLATGSGTMGWCCHPTPVRSLRPRDRRECTVPSNEAGGAGPTPGVRDTPTMDEQSPGPAQIAPTLTVTGPHIAAGSDCHRWKDNLVTLHCYEGFPPIQSILLTPRPPPPPASLCPWPRQLRLSLSVSSPSGWCGCWIFSEKLVFMWANSRTVPHVWHQLPVAAWCLRTPGSFATRTRWGALGLHLLCGRIGPQGANGERMEHNS